MHRIPIVCSCALLLALCAFTGLAQQEPAAETAARVPELEKFHEVIYTLWHTAWPAKDIATLEKLLPAIEKDAAAVTSAKLPGILREKTEAWNAGVAKLNASVAGYREAVAAKDSVKLLAAAEELHMRYEGLVRIVRPVMKELDEFHTVLYMLYHYYWPEGNGAKMKESAAGLTEKMALLEKGVLPKKYEAKAERFNSARANLGVAVKEFQAALAVEGAVLTKESMSDLVNKVHARYQVVEKVFE
jgi:hypothetical protein